jgi:HAMP domain-containing protein
MKLMVKFNVVLLLVFIIGFLIAGHFSRSLLQQNAQQEVFENARIMMEAALAVRAYTNNEIKPLLDTQLKYSFLPQSVPAYSANRYFSQLHKTFPDYTYREATLNPTNPSNRATSWESDVVNIFRQSPGKTEVVGQRDTPSGRLLYMARPIAINNAQCLQCHSTPETAPRTMIDRYGPDNGFGWQLNDVVGAQIVSAPMRLPTARANRVYKAFMFSLAVVFVMIFLAVNAMLTLFIIRPVTRLSKIADEVSLGNMDAPEFAVSGRDEIATLSDSLGRMRKSMVKAIKMIDN